MNLRREHDRHFSKIGTFRYAFCPRFAGTLSKSLTSPANSAIRRASG